MSRKFSVGDRVRVNMPGRRHHGVVTTVISVLRDTVRIEDAGVEILHSVLYALDPGDFSIPRPACVASELIPIYDGNERVSWSSCVWQPSGVRA